MSNYSKLFEKLLYNHEYFIVYSNKSEAYLETVATFFNNL